MGDVIYTLKSTDHQLANELMQVVYDDFKERENQAQTVLVDQHEPPGNIWDMGTFMWEPGAQHLDATWKTDVVHKDLDLKSVPTLKIYRAIVEQMQSAILPATPGVEFSYTPPEDAAAPDGSPIPDGDDLTDRWRNLSQHSRILGELDLVVQHSCNYGIGYMAPHVARNGNTTIRAIHPQVVAFNLDAERPDDIDWIAKLTAVARRQGNVRDVAAKSAIGWPTSILPQPDISEIRLEVWIRKGATVAGRQYTDVGWHGVIRADGEIVEEEDWGHTWVPLIPFSLIPAERMIGTSLALKLYESQVRIDKLVAIYMSRMIDCSGRTERYGSDSQVRVGANPAVDLTSKSDASAIKAGKKIIVSDQEFQVAEPPPVPEDIANAIRFEIHLMERLAGITDVFQGWQIAGSPSGRTITKLTENASRGVNRMATHLVESYRSLCKAWAIMVLSDYGVEVDIDDIAVEVSFTALDENNRARKFDVLKSMIQVGQQIPAELIVSVIPGLSREERDRYIALFEQQTAREEELAMMQKGIAPGGPSDAPQEPGMMPPAEAPFPAAGEEELPPDVQQLLLDVQGTMTANGEEAPPSEALAETLMTR
jgi:hypothetical protein